MGVHHRHHHHTALAYTTITIITLTPCRPAGYVYAACKKSQVKAAVSQETGNIWKWSIPVSPSECGSLSLAPSHSIPPQPSSSSSISMQPEHPATAAAPQLKCCGCMEHFPASGGCECSRMSHFWCNECFSDMVMSQVTGEGKPVFLANGCVITCAVCQAASLHTVFEVRLCAPHLSPTAYSAYLKTMAEPEVVREQLLWQQRMQQQLLQTHVTEALSVQNADDQVVQNHLAHIADQLILPRCVFVHVSLLGVHHPCMCVCVCAREPSVWCVFVVYTILACVVVCARVALDCICNINQVPPLQRNGA